MEDASALKQLRLDSWERALHAYGTCKLLRLRARRLGRNLSLLTYMGLVIPLMAGALALSYGVDFFLLPLVLAIGVAAAIIQLLVSLWAATHHWARSYADSLVSASANEKLFDSFERLAKDPSPQLADYRQTLDVLKNADDSQRQHDEQHAISEKERRYGMRAALFKRRAPCAGCNLVPRNLKPSECEVCGDFPKRWAR